MVSYWIFLKEILILPSPNFVVSDFAATAFYGYGFWGTESVNFIYCWSFICSSYCTNFLHSSRNWDIFGFNIYSICFPLSSPKTLFFLVYKIFSSSRSLALQTQLTQSNESTEGPASLFIVTISPAMESSGWEPQESQQMFPATET